MFNQQNKLIDFNVTEYKIVNDIVSGPLWKKPLRNCNLYSFSFVSKMNIHNYIKRLFKNTTPTCVWAFSQPHFSTLAWKIPWTEEPGRLQSMGSLRVGHDWIDLAAAAVAADFNQNNRLSGDANLKIQWASSEKDKKHTWKKCKCPMLLTTLFIWGNSSSY